MKESVIRALLFDFFEGKTTSIQRKMIEEWLAEPQNEELYYRYLDQWESEHPQFAPDADHALAHFQTMLSGIGDEPVQPIGREPVGRVSRNTWLWTAAAAMITIVFGVAFQKQVLYKSLESAPGRTVSYRLSEGTEVLLNANSSLLVPRFGFSGSTREVILDGEAEFKVTHTAGHDRFVVKMGDHYQIEVLGTEFVAFSRARGKRVFLKNGKVKLQLPQGKQVYMKPGSLFVSGRDGAFKMTAPADPRPYTAWKEQTFYFDNTLLSDVAAQIEEQFDVRVRIPDTLLAQRRIGGIYKATQADDLLLILSDLMEIEITQKEDHIELTIPKLP
ncbi:anti-sigma factor [Dyadobacter beijingensis]|uniref:Anti-sigma factor n=1 Tax=Dyadobacter beijingensis TaxID=365489 RepID=A0ABQ2I3H0_9BACT|nr:FecR domain-containing protein [Dyadobacter beijingensis]GGM96565.1 anti-sigma factor [Dyadobacter beijingensis]